jgi:hypothetical protein
MFAPASRPTSVPQAPLRPLQSASRLGGQVCISRAKAASGLQRVFEAYCSMPPIQHDCGICQRPALQPPQPSVAITQHRRRRVRGHAGQCERLLESIGRDHRAVARESEAGLVSFNVDYLAGDHLKVAFVLPVSAADVAAIKPNNDGFGRPRRHRLRRFRSVRQHNGLTDPHGSVPHSARVQRPADRQQLRQQLCYLAKRRHRRIPRRHIGQFGRYGRGLEVEGGETPCYASILARTGEQAPNPHWHIAEQRAERRAIMSLAGQPTPASRAGAAMLTGDRHLCRDDLRLDRGCQPFCL